MPFTATINIVRGRSLQAARILAGLDQRQVAKMLGWSPAKLSALENGAPVSKKAWLELRRALARKGVTIIAIPREGSINLLGSFEEPEVEEDDQSELD